MNKARELGDLLESDGDVKSSALDKVAVSLALSFSLKLENTKICDA